MRKAVLFDLDGTLHDRDTSMRRFAHGQYGRWVHVFGHVPRQVYVERFVKLDQKGRVWKDRVYGELLAEFEASGASVDELVADYVNRFPAHAAPYPQLHEVLAQLREQGWRIGLVTNGPQRLQWAVIYTLGIERYLDDVRISEAEGVKKPDPDIFRRALGGLGVPAERSVFVGDHPDHDVHAARQVGMKAIWKRDPFWPSPQAADGAVEQLQELLPALARIEAAW